MTLPGLRHCRGGRPWGVGFDAALSLMGAAAAVGPRAAS